MCRRNAAFFIKMNKVNLSTVTFSNEWRQILKSNNLTSKSFISIYLDLSEISNKSKDNFLFYKENNDSYIPYSHLRTQE